MPLSTLQPFTVATALVFTNVEVAESARQAVLLQSGLAVPNNYAVWGYNLLRTGGSDGDVVTTVRLWDATSSGSGIYRQTHTIGANDDPAGVTELTIPLGSATYDTLAASLQNDTGTTQDYELLLYLTPIKRV